jgi:hypothetical protein
MPIRRSRRGERASKNGRATTGRVFTLVVDGDDLGIVEEGCIRQEVSTSIYDESHLGGPLHCRENYHSNSKRQIQVTEETIAREITGQIQDIHRKSWLFGRFCPQRLTVMFEDNPPLSSLLKFQSLPDILVVLIVCVWILLSRADFWSRCSLYLHFVWL